MPIRRSLWAVALPVVGVIAVGAEPTFLSDLDVYFTTRGAQLEQSSTGTNLQRPAAAPSDAPRLCGFQIRGNHRERHIPHPEWDLNIDEIMTGDQHIVGITAGAFDVLTSDRSAQRKPRPPIVRLGFLVPKASESIEARIVGAPNAANAIQAVLEREQAEKVFDTLLRQGLLTISIDYQDGTADTLQVRGWSDNRKFGGVKNGYLDECRRGRGPFTNMRLPVP